MDLRRSERFGEYKNFLPLPTFELRTDQSFIIRWSIVATDYTTSNHAGRTYILIYITDEKYKTEVGNHEGEMYVTAGRVE